MILNVENVRKFYDSDKVTEVKLQSLELLLHDTTNNNFSRYKNTEGVIEYPVNIIEGFAKIIEWETIMKSKIGIASESISRHSVTYSKTTENGYPEDLMTFMNKYVKARF